VTGRSMLCVLDVEGVVVLEDPVVPAVQHTINAYGKWRRDVLVPEAAPRKLRELAERFDCAWMTGWAHTAHPALRAALDLPVEPWPWRAVQFRKLPAIRELAAGRPWVWIDDGIDDLGAQPDVPDGVLVRVDPRRGIADLDPAALALAAGRL
jgi:hypothetical protein